MVELGLSLNVLSLLSFKPSRDGANKPGIQKLALCYYDFYSLKKSNNGGVSWSQVNVHTLARDPKCVNAEEATVGMPDSFFLFSGQIYSSWLRPRK